MGRDDLEGQRLMFDVDGPSPASRRLRRDDGLPAGTVPCRAVGCGNQIDQKLLMCRRHWKMVPASLREGVWKHFRDGQTYETATLDYWKSAAEAVEFVARLEGREPANRFRKRAEELLAGKP